MQDDETCLLKLCQQGEQEYINWNSSFCTQQYKLYEEFHKISSVKHINKTAWQLVPISQLAELGWVYSNSKQGSSSLHILFVTFFFLVWLYVFCVWSAFVLTLSGTSLPLIYKLVNPLLSIKLVFPPFLFPFLMYISISILGNTHSEHSEHSLPSVHVSYTYWFRVCMWHTARMITTSMANLS